MILENTIVPEQPDGMQTGDNGGGLLVKPANKLSDFDYLRVTSRTFIDSPTPVITIGGETISTRGNITCISGPSKSGKSALTAVFVAGASSKDGQYDGFDQVRVAPNPLQKAVLHFDTEQSAYKQKLNLQGINKRLGLEESPDNLLSFNLRQEESRRYADLITSICAIADEVFGGIHLIVIDGAADFTNDVNEAVDSNKAVQFFDQLATQYNTVVVVIIHTNPGSEKERGHMGSQLQRKSESVLTVKQLGDMSFLEAKFLRMASKEAIPKIQFHFDKEKGYHTTSGLIGKNDLEKKLEELDQLAKAVFTGKELKYNDAISALMKQTGKKERLSKELFKELKAHEFVEQQEGKLWILKLDPEQEDEEQTIA